MPDRFPEFDTRGMKQIHSIQVVIHEKLKKYIQKEIRSLYLTQNKMYVEQD